MKELQTGAVPNKRYGVFFLVWLVVQEAVQINYSRCSKSGCNLWCWLPTSNYCVNMLLFVMANNLKMWKINVFTKSIEVVYTWIFNPATTIFWANTCEASSVSTSLLLSSWLLRPDFTFENASLMGLKSGEYEVNKNSNFFQHCLHFCVWSSYLALQQNEDWTHWKASGEELNVPVQSHKTCRTFDSFDV